MPQRAVADVVASGSAVRTADTGDGHTGGVPTDGVPGDGGTVERVAGASMRRFVVA